MEYVSGFAPRLALRLVAEGPTPYERCRRLCSPGEIFELVGPLMRDLPHEEVWCLHLDTNNGLRAIHRVSSGGLGISIVDPRQVFQGALLSNAASIVLVHNHPSFNPEPSDEDKRITAQILACGKLMGIPLHDHIVVAGCSYTSMASEGMMLLSYLPGPLSFQPETPCKPSSPKKPDPPGPEPTQQNLF